MDWPRSLLDFLRHSQPEIIAQFEAFARTFSTVAATMTAEELRDHAAELLTAIARDLETGQTTGEQSRKSEGHGSAHAMERSGRLHADARIDHGFTLAEVMAEFRALRGSVLALYDGHDGAIDLIGIRRFNEAIDEALTASVVRFSDRLTTYKEQFVGMLGHDLRSPLAAMTAGATLLSMPDVDAQQRPRVAAMMLRSARRMEAMIADLLDLTRSRLGTGIPVQVTPADLGEVCTQAILETQVSHPDRTIAYEMTGDLRGEWDIPRLMQVGTNLLHNALEHGERSPVSVATDGSTDHVRLRVSNRGPIIPRERLGNIFEPFVQHRPLGSAATEGLGLGLFIVHAIVAAHHGTITVDSTEADGTTFEVQLPRTHDSIPVGRSSEASNIPEDN